MTRIEERIVDYYDSCEIDYRLFWGLGKNLAMHYGYWDETTKTFAQALQRENEILATQANIKPSDHVLDAGCGVGGSTIFLAQTFGCRVTGITLSQKQVATAERNAKRHGVEGLVTFHRENYLLTHFTDQSFDVVWAIESTLYANDKAQFVQEAFRLLRPGGRLIMADFLAAKNEYNASEKILMTSWLRGWAVDSLETIANFETYLNRAGFKHISCRNITKHVLPSSRRLYLWSLLGLLFGKTLEWLRIRTKTQTGNIFAVYYSWQALQRNLWQYGILYAEK